MGRGEERDLPQFVGRGGKAGGRGGRGRRGAEIFGSAHERAALESGHEFRHKFRPFGNKHAGLIALLLAGKGFEFFEFVLAEHDCLDNMKCLAAKRAA